MQKSCRIVLSGSVSVDRIMNFSGSFKDMIKPDKLHVLSLSILIDSLTLSRGGIAPNIAYSLALLGDTPELLASIGSDQLEYKNDLTKLGIKTDHLHVSTLPTATFTVITDSDDNQVGGFYPGAMSDTAEQDLTPWHESDSLIVVSAGDPTHMHNLILQAKQNNLTLIFDPGQQVSNCKVETLLLGIQTAKVLFVNDYELGVIIERTGLSEAEITKTIPLVVTTLGRDGSRLSRNNQVTQVAAATGITPLDPTGAGDAYRAGFLYGYARSWDDATCAELGSILASFAIEVKGTQNHKSTKADIKDRYKKTYNKNIQL